MWKISSERKITVIQRRLLLPLLLLAAGAFVVGCIFFSSFMHLKLLVIVERCAYDGLSYVYGGKCLKAHMHIRYKNRMCSLRFFVFSVYVG